MKLQNELMLYVPRPGTWLGKSVIRGSALVGIPREIDVPGRVLVYYEGNLYGAENLKRYAERCLHAAERGVLRFPTVAFSETAVEDLIPVGKYHYADKVVEIDDAAVLKEWCGWGEMINAAELYV